MRGILEYKPLVTDSRLLFFVGRIINLLSYHKQNCYATFFVSMSIILFEQSKRMISTGKAFLCGGSTKLYQSLSLSTQPAHSPSSHPSHKGNMSSSFLSSSDTNTKRMMMFRSVSVSSVLRLQRHSRRGSPSYSAVMLLFPVLVATLSLLMTETSIIVNASSLDELRRIDPQGEIDVDLTMLQPTKPSTPLWYVVITFLCSRFCFLNMMRML